jgi:hypothetical protein
MSWLQVQVLSETATPLTDILAQVFMARSSCEYLGMAASGLHGIVGGI